MKIIIFGKIKLCMHQFTWLRTQLCFSLYNNIVSNSIIGQETSFPVHSTTTTIITTEQTTYNSE